ncbi:hypothetical protein HGRIS_011901 [Hohenbuehelia grisea]|uniref:DUF6699 domain-containing protein n=1 Tax=Hohenbuehelia grisea TaxID=104357 RepID=A0ABR3JWH3_9AGAR
MFARTNNKRVHFSTTDTVYTFTNASANFAPIPAPPSSSSSSSRRRRASMPASRSTKLPPPYTDGSDYTSDDSSSSVLSIPMVSRAAPRAYAPIPLHYLLAFTSQTPFVDFDISLPPSKTAFMSAPVILLEPATAPPLSLLSIRCPGTPWTVTVAPSYGGVVSVWDVLVAIYSTLRRSVTPDEYAALPSHEATKRVNAAYRSRHSHIGDPEKRWKEEQKGVKRVDFLQGMNRFMGLTTTAEDYPGMWTLVVTSLR